jgi:hypothetical protein
MGEFWSTVRGKKRLFKTEDKAEAGRLTEKPIKVLVGLSQFKLDAHPSQHLERVDQNGFTIAAITITPAVTPGISFKSRSVFPDKGRSPRANFFA